MSFNDLLNLGKMTAGTAQNIASLATTDKKLEAIKKYDPDFANYLKLGLGTVKGADNLLKSGQAIMSLYNSMQAGKPISEAVASIGDATTGLSGMGVAGEAVVKTLPWVGLGLGLYDIASGDVNENTIPTLGVSGAALLGGQTAAGAAAIPFAPLAVGNALKAVFHENRDSFQDVDEYFHAKPLQQGVSDFIKGEDGYWYFTHRRSTGNDDQQKSLVRYNPEKNIFEVYRAPETRTDYDTSEDGSHDVVTTIPGKWEPAPVTLHNGKPWLLVSSKYAVPVVDMQKRLYESGVKPGAETKVKEDAADLPKEVTQASWLVQHPTYKTGKEYGEHSPYKDTPTLEAVFKTDAPGGSEMTPEEKRLAEGTPAEETMETPAQEAAETASHPVYQTQADLEELFGLPAGALAEMAEQVKQAIGDVNTAYNSDIKRPGLSLIPKGAQDAATKRLMALTATYNPYDMAARTIGSEETTGNRAWNQMRLNEQSNALAKDKLNYVNELQKDYSLWAKDNDVDRYYTPDMNSYQKAAAIGSLLGGVKSAGSSILKSIDSGLGLGKKIVDLFNPDDIDYLSTGGSFINDPSSYDDWLSGGQGSFGAFTDPSDYSGALFDDNWWKLKL